MKTLPAPALAALQARAVELRDMIWIVARDRNTGDPVPYGAWSDLQSATLDITEPDTGATVQRLFEGAGNLVQIGAVPRVANLTAQSVQVMVSQLGNANELIRAYDLRQARVEIYRALFAPGTLNQLSPGIARFVGFVDEIEITTPKENEAGSARLECISHMQELGRSNPATRSDAFQQARASGDTFRRHAATVATWEMKWGVAE